MEMKKIISRLTSGGKSLNKQSIAQWV